MTLPSSSGGSIQVLPFSIPITPPFLCSRRHPSRQRVLILPFRRLELGDDDRLVRDFERAVLARDKGMLQPVRVVAFGVILSIVRAPALGAIERGEGRHFGQIEQAAQLPRLIQVGIELGAFILDRDARVTLFQISHTVERLLQHRPFAEQDRKSTRLNSSHGYISYAVFCLKKNKNYLNTALDSTRAILAIRPNTVSLLC